MNYVVRGLILGMVFGMISIVTACGQIRQDGSIQAIIADGAELHLVKDGFAFTEGPAADAEGNVYFTDQPNNRIWKYTINGKLELFMNQAGRSNGMFFDKYGALFTCADEHNQLWRIRPDGQIDTLVKHYQDSLLNGPNDLWIAPDQSIYFTDPYYQRDYWTRKAPDMHSQSLYRYTPDGKLLQLDSCFKKPNGIIGTPDGKWLYVADIGDSKTYRYRRTKKGTLKDRRLFVSQGSDGMTLDEQGNLYLSGNGVTVYNVKGKQIAYIPVPAKWVGNICFGGRNRDLLFITASDRVFTLQMKVKGTP